MILIGTNLTPVPLNVFFLDIPEIQKRYRWYNPILRKHFVSTDVTFFEDTSYYSTARAQLLEPLFVDPVVPAIVLVHHSMPPYPNILFVAIIHRLSRLLLPLFLLVLLP